MASLGIFEMTGVTSIMLFLAPEAMNRLFNYIVPIYTVLAIVVIVAFVRLEKSEGTKKQGRIYNVPRKAKPGVELTWKQKFVGTWDKYERTGFLEFVIFMGVVKPSMAKLLQKSIENQPLQNVIAYKDDSEKELKIDTLGKPESHGAWCLVAADEASATSAEFEVDKEKVIEKIWWEEEIQTMHRTMQFQKSGRVMAQSRTVNEEDRLLLTTKMTKPDGESIVFYVKFKRVVT